MRNFVVLSTDLAGMIFKISLDDFSHTFMLLISFLWHLSGVITQYETGV